MSTSTLGSSQTNSEWDKFSLEEKLNSLEYLTSSYEHYLEKGEKLTDAMQQYRDSSSKQCEANLQQLIQMKQMFQKDQDNMHSACETSLEKVSNTLKPYLGHDSQVMTQSTGESLKNRMMAVIAQIAGIEAQIRRTSDISKKVMNDHELLGKMEKRQQDIISRFQEVVRVENLASGVSEGDNFYHLVNLPQHLLALSIHKNISPYYQKRFKNLQERVSAIVAQIRYNSHACGMEPLQMRTLKNGEISKKSIEDEKEYPVD